MRGLLNPNSSETGHDPTRGSGHGGFKISRVGSGQVITFENLTDRVASGQEVSTSRGSGRVGSRGVSVSRVGSGRVNRFSKSRWSGRVMAREMRVTRGSSHHDPRVVFG